MIDAMSITFLTPEQRRLHHLGRFVVCPDTSNELSPIASMRIRLADSSPGGMLRKSCFFPVAPELKQHKHIKWKEATTNRPPLRIEMNGPGPEAYLLTGNLPCMTNAPAFSFARKVPNQGTKKRIVLGKVRYTNVEPVKKKKSNFVRRHPFYYELPSLLGPKQITKRTYPNYTVMHLPLKPPKPKVAKCFYRLPMRYDISLADEQVFPTAASYTIAEHLPRHKPDETPASDAYNICRGIYLINRQSPCYSFNNTRREKRHELGPFTTF